MLIWGRKRPHIWPYFIRNLMFIEIDIRNNYLILRIINHTNSCFFLRKMYICNLILELFDIYLSYFHSRAQFSKPVFMGLDPHARPPPPPKNEQNQLWPTCVHRSLFTVGVHAVWELLPDGFFVWIFFLIKHHFIAPPPRFR